MKEAYFYDNLLVRTENGKKGSIANYELNKLNIKESIFQHPISFKRENRWQFKQGMAFVNYPQLNYMIMTSVRPIIEMILLAGTFWGIQIGCDPFLSIKTLKFLYITGVKKKVLRIKTRKPLMRNSCNFVTVLLMTRHNSNSK